jgi:hypothetical protein
MGPLMTAGTVRPSLQGARLRSLRVRHYLYGNLSSFRTVTVFEDFRAPLSVVLYKTAQLEIQKNTGKDTYISKRRGECFEGRVHCCGSSGYEVAARSLPHDRSSRIEAASQYSSTVVQ